MDHADDQTPWPQLMWAESGILGCLGRKTGRKEHISNETQNKYLLKLKKKKRKEKKPLNGI